MIRKLLVANRGEIAVRIIRACRELGILTVAVYSEADAGAMHSELADESVAIGPAASTASYLNIDRLIEAARRSGADAVHPGYGFLSQSPAFADACANAGLIFVGPSAESIAAMGVKIGARALMQQAGVPVVPGTSTDQSDAAIEAAALRIGLPVMVKASAGGGGKGMRTVTSAGELAAAVQAARREAQAAFGDGTLYVEKRIERPHHVEVQVFGDAAGHVTHVFERECSVQRRHQKVIEESPAPSIDADLRREMSEAAVRAAGAVSYRSAGTVEFLLEPATRSFYFLEMNTRLQVEHPVTEFVAGVDLVRAQLLVASGEPLPWTASDLSQRGHAIEARVYAEDPSRGFLPQAGRLLLYRAPQIPGVRIDSGVREGEDVSVHYDPLLAKVIACDETREAAVARLEAALTEFPILGIRTNIPFVLAVLRHDEFRSGRADTEWLDRDGAALAQGLETPMPGHVRAAVEEHRKAPQRGAAHAWSPWEAAGPPKSAARADVAALGDGSYRVKPVSPVNDEGRYVTVYVASAGQTIWAFDRGRVYVETTGAGERTRAHASSGATQALTAPMPGTVVRVLVEPGAKVARGETLVILEAMKMELPVRAMDDGTVTRIACRPGELVAADAVLIEVGPTFRSGVTSA